MAYENPENIIRSWNIQSNFATGPVTADQLVPPQYGRIRTPFLTTWREEKVNSTLDWESSNFSIYLPESLRVLHSVFLKIELPALASTTYKNYPGLYAIKNVRIMSAGQEVYTIDFFTHMVDHLQAMRTEEAQAFANAYLGYEGTLSLTARDIMLPIMIPNSPCIMRNGADRRGHGVFPCYLGQNRLEVQITMNAAKYMGVDASVAPGSISNKCSLMYNECKMTQADTLGFSDHRGKYSLINRRFTEITSGWQHYTTADAIGTWNINHPRAL